MKPFLFALLALFFVSTAEAATYTGQILMVNIGNLHSADLTGGATIVFAPGWTVSGTVPSCSTNRQMVTFDSTTANGQSLARMFLSAKYMGETVTVYGTGNCNYSGIGEDISQADFL